ncbi:MAG: hypothetical protein ACXWCZ_14375 [Flavisolibacter sp.]
MAAQSIAFFFRHVLKNTYVIPTVIYPRTASKLPAVMSAIEIKCLSTNNASAKDTTPKVTGIGGIFFYSNNLKGKRKRYSNNLGIVINDWSSSSFEFRNVKRPDEINSVQWKPFKKGDEYFSHPKRIL